MKKKYVDNSDEENEFDVDEPEEIQNNASDDDWTPDKDTSTGRRTSTRLRNIPKSRAPIIDASSSDDENSDESQGSKRKFKGRGRGRPPVKKHKVTSSTSSSMTPNKTKEDSTNKSISSDSEPTSTTTPNSGGTPTVTKINKDFTSGAFVVLKADAANLEADPPLWKIDGKALLQKYIAFEQDGITLYKNTSVYSGWTINNKDNYLPVSVLFKQQTRKEHIVEFHRDQIKFNSSSEVSSSVPETVDDNTTSNSPVQVVPEPEKPVIKVKSFAVVHEEEPKTPAKPIKEEKENPPENNLAPQVIKINDNFVPENSLVPQVIKINKNFVSGAFLVLRSDAANDYPPLWKIDGKSLLQKYTAFNQNGKTFYKNTAEYSGWSMSNKSCYFPASVIFKQQNKKDHIVELDRVKWNEPDEDST